MWAEKWTIMQEASGSSTAPNAAGESVAKPETPLLIILSIACKWGPWQHVQSGIRKAKTVDKNILGRWLKQF